MRDWAFRTEILSQLQSLDEKITLLDTILIDNDNNAQSLVLVLPNDFFTDNSSDISNKKISWKKMALTIFSKFDMPMTTEFLLEKATASMPEIKGNRRFILKNFSSALYNLTEYDNRLFRTKINGRDYVYGFQHHFDDNGKLKPEYLSKYNSYKML